jgi:hypothetical protein
MLVPVKAVVTPLEKFRGAAPQQPAWERYVSAGHGTLLPVRLEDDGSERRSKGKEQYQF